jgi:beta-ring hydroxylase
MCVQGKSIEMEELFSKLTLDIIGKAVFNYDFDSLSRDDDIIQVQELNSRNNCY